MVILIYVESILYLLFVEIFYKYLYWFYLFFLLIMFYFFYSKKSLLNLWSVIMYSPEKACYLEKLVIRM